MKPSPFHMTANIYVVGELQLQKQVFTPNSTHNSHHQVFTIVTILLRKERF